MVAVLLLVIYVPAIAWLWFFWTRDRYEREPKRLIINLFLLGLGSYIAAQAVGRVIEEVLVASAFGGIPRPGDAIVQPLAAVSIIVILLSAFNQEAMKLGFAISRVRHDAAFSEPVDGIIYLTSLALGFAAAQGTSYGLCAFSAAIGPGGDICIAFGSSLEIGALRALLAMLGHVFFSGVAGFYLSRYVLKNASRSVLLQGLLAAVALHALYDAALAVGSASSDDQLLSQLPSVLVLALAGVIYVVLFRRALAESPFRAAALAQAQTTAAT